MAIGGWGKEQIEFQVDHVLKGDLAIVDVRGCIIWGMIVLSDLNTAQLTLAKDGLRWLMALNGHRSQVLNLCQMTASLM